MFPPGSCWSTLRTVLVIMIAASLLLVSTVAWSVDVGARGQSQKRHEGKPRREKPEGELPDLEEVERESQIEREAPAAIPSTLRSPKVPLEPWNGRRVGDPEAQSKKDPVLRAHARRRFNSPAPAVPDDQFVQNFFLWAVSRTPSASELTYWNDQLRVAYAQGQPSLKLAAVEFGKTIVNGVPSQVITTYSVAGDGACVLTAPDGTIYKEYYGTGWQKGMTTLSEVWSGGVKQKWTTIAWTQDNTAVGYELNPRVVETNVYDVSGNRRRIVIDYDHLRL